MQVIAPAPGQTLPAAGSGRPAAARSVRSTPRWSAPARPASGCWSSTGRRERLDARRAPPRSTPRSNGSMADGRSPAHRRCGDAWRAALGDGRGPPPALTGRLRRPAPVLHEHGTSMMNPPVIDLPSDWPIRRRPAPAVRPTAGDAVRRLVVTLDGCAARGRRPRVLLLSGDPVRFPEALDVAVVLLELRRAHGDRFDRPWYRARTRRPWHASTGSQRWPTLLFFLRDGRYVTAAGGHARLDRTLCRAGRQDARSRRPARRSASAAAGTGADAPSCH